MKKSPQPTTIHIKGSVHSEQDIVRIIRDAFRKGDIDASKE